MKDNDIRIAVKADTKRQVLAKALRRNLSRRVHSIRGIVTTSDALQVAKVVKLVVKQTTVEQLFIDEKLQSTDCTNHKKLEQD